MGPEQWLFLQWHEHKGSLVSTFEKLFERNTFVDCTLAAEGQYLNVHKVILSACSPYFEILLNENRDKHPIIILKDVKFRSLKSIIEYMYRGEANVLSTEIKDFLAAAESLQIKGLGKQGGGDSKGQPTKDLRDLIDAQPLPPSNAMRVIGEEKDKWGDSDLSSTITDTAQESVVTQKNTLLFSQGDVGTKVPISQKVPKPVAINENLNTEQSWLKTEKADEALKVLNKVLPPHSTLNIGSHTIEPVHPASKDMLPNANVCAASTQSIPSTSDVQMAMEVTPKAEPEDLPAPAAAVDIEDAETASLASSVIELSDTTEEWAEEDMEEAPTPSQATGNSFAGGSEEARARSEAAPGDAAREVAAGDAAAEQQGKNAKVSTQRRHSVNSGRESTFGSRQKLLHAGTSRAELAGTSCPTTTHTQKYNDRSPQKLHNCPYCNKAFFRSSYLKDHMTNHNESKPLECKEYTRKLKNIVCVKRHTSCGDKSHLCKAVNCPETKLCDVKEEHDITHTKQPPYVCGLRDFPTSQTGPLIIHQRFNNGAKPSQCKECQISASRNSQLQRGGQIHAGEESQNQICTKCGYTSAQSYSLKIHLRDHKGRPYRCPECNIQFGHKCALINHRAKTHGAQPR